MDCAHYLLPRTLMGRYTFDKTQPVVVYSLEEPNERTMMHDVVHSSYIGTDM